MHIKSLNIVPGWHFESEAGERLHPELLELLQHIEQQGRLTAAAQASGLSYRHAWNLLNSSADLLGTPLVHLEKGRGARLSLLGQKLLRGVERVDARLHPQMESLAMELNVELHRAMADLSPVLRIFASHGYAVALLPQFAADYQVEMHYHSPQEALMGLTAGRCKIAGFHQAIGLELPEQKARYRELLDPERFGIIRFIRRQQGLMYAPDNPFAISGLADLTQSGLSFINRQYNSGTRQLLDQLLVEDGIDPARIEGYGSEEYTHSAIAAHVASSMADAGFGVEVAARRFGLGFTPIIQEYYYWAYPLACEGDEEVQALLQTLRDPAFQRAVDELPGYQCNNCGTLISPTAIFDGAD